MGAAWGLGGPDILRCPWESLRGAVGSCWGCMVVRSMPGRARVLGYSGVNVHGEAGFMARTIP